MNLINKKELFLLEEIVRRNFSAKYKDSVLGILWSVLNPLLTMLLLTIVFSTIFHNSIENYPVYLLSGRCIFTFFTGSISTSMNAIQGNKNILLKTAAPKHIFIIGGIISEFFNFIISVLLLIGVMIVTNAPFHFSVLPLTIIPIISTMIMVTGLGLMLSIICVYYKDVKHLWSFISLALMYSSAIFYPMSIIPEPYHQYLILNPVFWVIDQFRCFVIQGIVPHIPYMLNSLLLSLIILVIGIIVFKKYEKKVTLKF